MKGIVGRIRETLIEDNLIIYNISVWLDTNYVVDILKLLLDENTYISNFTQKTTLWKILDKLVLNFTF